MSAALLSTFYAVLIGLGVIGTSLFAPLFLFF